MKRVCSLPTVMVCFALSTLLSTQVTAQSGKAFYKTSYKNRNSGSFDRRSGLFSLGLGIPSRYTSYYNGLRNNISFPPLYVKYEHGVMDEVGIGGYVAAAGSRYRYRIGNGSYVDTRLHVSLAAMGYYHFNKLIPVRKLDVYAGVGLGLRQTFYRDDFDNERSSDVDPLLVGKVGARYYFSRGFGVYGEAGYDGISDLNFGITFRF